MQYNLAEIFNKLGIKGVSCDSRQVKAGDAFFAIKGENFDGNKFIYQALTNGAKIAFTEDPNYTNSEVIYTEDARKALAEGASIIYPKLPKYLVAVTGTNGKSSVVHYCRQIFELLKIKSASLGTIGVEINDKNLQAKFSGEKYSSLTTADTITLRQILNELAENNVECVAFEASSHGLDQNRLYGIKAQCAGFTSFSQDHLDYHKNMEEYLKAKIKLFTDNLQPGGIAVLNAEIPEISLIKEIIEQRDIKIITIGKGGDIDITSTEALINGQNINFIKTGRAYNFTTEIIGSFQASNILMAAIFAEFYGLDFDSIIKVLPRLSAVKGRLERVTNCNNSYQVLVDYSHKPLALEKALLELRKITPIGGKLKVIFGCGGNRDKLKRPIMGAIAEKIADEVIITDDNPRLEDPASIRKEILSGMRSGREIGDRKAAINTVISELKNKDVLLIAGKGHEEYQIIGNQKFDFSDVVEAKKALEGRKE